MHMRFIPAMALLAGALALAGCGGGSGVTPGSGGNGDSDDDSQPPPAGNTDALKPYIIEGGFLHTDLDEGDDGIIPTGDSVAIGGITVRGVDHVHGAKITCPDESKNGCRWLFENGQLMLSGGATAERIPEPTIPEANTADKTGGAGDIDWLSDRALIRAIKENDAGHIYVEIEAPNGAPVRGRDSANAIIGPVGTAAGGSFDSDRGSITGGSATNHFVIDTLGGRETDLRLVHTRGRTVAGTGVVPDIDTLRTDYLVFGAWERRTAAQEGPKSDPELGYLATGTIPRNDPQAFGIGDARYEGKALGHYSHDGGDWTEWEGTVLLEANFAPDERNIDGTVKTGISAVSGLATINLEKTRIGSSVSGSSEIDGSKQSSGTWKAGFYGTAIDGSPNGVAGSFRAIRPEVDTQKEADLQGAFGAHNVGQLNN